MGTELTTNEQVELLFKRFLGYPYAQPGATYLNEGSSNADKRILSTQLISDDIPGKITNTLTLTNDATFNSQYGERFTLSAPYQHIVKYEKLLLTHVKPQYTYWYAEATPTTPEKNRLSNAINPNYDKTSSSYVVHVYITPDTGIEFEVGPFNENYPWIFDNDAGYLIFIKPVPSTYTIKITFWRYEGRFGFQTVGSTAQKFIFDGGAPSTPFNKYASASFDAGGANG